LFSKLLTKTIKYQYPIARNNTKVMGDWAEQLACDWLRKHGLNIQARNFRSRYGEIDLFMKNGNCLVFVEVKYRKNTFYGSAEEAITAKKCQRLKVTAENYLQTNAAGNNTEARFDAVAISPVKESDLHCTINWIKNILL
jgi:putative endonuclease